METLGVNSDIDSIVRLGKLESENKRNRPIRVRFNSEQDKIDVMSRLSNLKKAEEKFNRISITDDYTIQEREEIQRFVAEAKRKNANETENFFWRVRGSPKTGLELRKVPKRLQK